MKKIILFIIGVTAVTLAFLMHPPVSTRPPDLLPTQKGAGYRVYKVDSFSHFYLVYARIGQDRYKIVSPISQASCRNITVDRVYPFRLHSYLETNGKPNIPVGADADLSAWLLESTTCIKLEGDSLQHLYYAENIEGLCFLQHQ